MARLRRKLGSESVKTQFSKIYFSQTYFLMAMNSHACLSGVSLADMYLTGYISHRIRISLGVRLTGRASYRRTSLRRTPRWAYLMGVHLMGVHLMGVFLMGVHLMGMYLMGVSLMSVHLTGC